MIPFNAQEAIAVNQAWAGHPGMLVQNILRAPQHWDPRGITVPSSSSGDFGTTGGASMGGAWGGHGSEDLG